MYPSKVMKLAYIDTSSISNCIDQNISADRLNEILRKKNMIPAIGIQVTYELAKTLISITPDKTAQFYAFLRDLKPKIHAAREKLYFMECMKLKYDSPVNYSVEIELELSINLRINEYCNGNYNSAHIYYIKVELPHFNNDTECRS